MEISECKGCGRGYGGTFDLEPINDDGYCAFCQYELEQKQDHKTEQE